MTTIINSEMFYDNVLVIARKGETMWIRHIIAETLTDALATMEEDKGNTKITFKVDTLVVVENLHSNGKTAKHLRFARAARKNGQLHNEIKQWPRLRVAMRHWNEQGKGPFLFNAPGGLEYAVAYSDEMIVADYSLMGSHGWIIKKSNIGTYLDALPPLQDSGKIGVVFVNHVGWLNTPDECNIDITDEDPSGEEAPTYYDRARGCSMSSNHHIFKVEIDLGSLVINRVVELIDGKEAEECGGVGFQTHPIPRSVAVGKRAPSALTCYLSQN